MSNRKKTLNCSSAKKNYTTPAKDCYVKKIGSATRDKYLIENIVKTPKQLSELGFPALAELFTAEHFDFMDFFDIKFYPNVIFTKDALEFIG